MATLSRAWPKHLSYPTVSSPKGRKNELIFILICIFPNGSSIFEKDNNQYYMIRSFAGGDFKTANNMRG